MATIPTAPTWLVGEDITDVDLQALSDYCRFVMETKPITVLVAQVDQTGWSSATYTAVEFGAGSEVLDTDTQHSTSSNTSRVTIGDTLGYYRLTGVVTFNGLTTTTLVRAGFALNGSMIAGSISSMAPLSSSSALSVVAHSTIVEATSSSDYVELMGWQTASGTPRGPIVSGGNFASSFTVEYIKKP